MNLQDQIRDKDLGMTMLRSNFDELKRNNKELQEKYNTWSALSAEYK